MDEVKKLMSSILISSKDGIPASRIEVEYRDICMVPLPYRALGFSTAGALMDAMPDVAYTRRDSQGVLRYYAKGNERTQHILKLVRNQKSNRKAPKKPSSGIRSRPTPGKRSNAAPPVDFRRPPIAGNVPHPSSFPLPSGSTSLGAFSGGERKVMKTAVEKITEGLRRLATPTAPTSANTVHRTAASLVDSRQTSSTNSLRSAIVTSNFDVHVGAGDTSRAINVDASRSHFSPTQAAFAANRNDSSRDSSSFARVAEGDTHRQASVQSFAAASPQNKKAVIAQPGADHAVVRMHLQQILAAKPYGVRLAALPGILKERTHQDPPENLEALVRHWSDIIEVDDINLVGSNAIVYGKRATSVPKDVGGKCDVASSYTTAVVKPHLSFTSGDCTECRITHIVSINEFYIHLQGSSALTSLMEKMQEYYNKDEEASVVPINSSCVDCFCAVKNEECDVWSRGRIVKVGLETADILYIDFGGLATVPLSQIRPLAQAFVQPEEQAIRCCLTGFGQSDFPPDQVQQMTEKFRQLAQQEWLTAVVTKVFKTPRCHEVDIYVTRGLVFVNECINRGGASATSSTASNTLPALQIPTCAYLDVSVTFIESHTTVILQILGAQHSDRLEALTQEARDFYTSPNGKQKRASSITAGAIYMVEVENGWFRMKVVPSSLLKESHTQVLCTFVDYGDVAVVTRNDIYELDARFTNLPCQAVACTLEDLDDPSASDVVVERMVDMLSTLTIGKSLVALVNTECDTPEKDVGLLVTLFDTNGDVDININTRLAEVAFTVEPSDFKDFRRVSSSSSLRTNDELKGVSVSSASPSHWNDNFSAPGCTITTAGPATSSTLGSTDDDAATVDICGTPQASFNASANVNNSNVEDPMDIPLPRSPLSAGKFLYVYITHVNSPDDFAAVPKYDLAGLSSMTEEMCDAYTTSSTMSAVSRTVPRVGGWYAALLDNSRFYRVKVVKVNADSTKVNVYSVDFGDTREITASALLPLFNKFKFIPALAMKMKLADVRPRGDRNENGWSPEICQRFSELVIDKMLYAVGVSVLKDSNNDCEISEVRLVETSSEEDVDIGTVLHRK